MAVAGVGVIGSMPCLEFGFALLLRVWRYSTMSCEPLGLSIRCGSGTGTRSEDNSEQQVIKREQKRSTREVAGSAPRAAVRKSKK